MSQGSLGDLRRRVRWFLALGVAAALGGCGSSGPDDATAPSQAAVDAPEVWDMVLIGDSFVALPSWPDLYAAEIEQAFGIDVRVHDFSRSGGPDIFGAISAETELRDALSMAEVTLVQPDVGPPTDRAEASWFEGTCGGSDGLRCFRREVRAFRADWQDAAQEIVGLRSPDEAIIRAFQVGTWVYDTYYGSGFRETADWETVLAGMIQLNDAIAEIAGAAGIAVINVNAAFSGPDYRQPLSPELSDDGFHPSARGSEVIVELLIASGWDPMDEEMAMG